MDEEEDWAPIPRRKRMALITQSTQPPWKFEKLAAFLVPRAHELKIVNTVCPVTIRRQEDTMETAREVDLMVVVGGRHSANTKELTRLCGIAGTPALQIENARDLLDPAPFERVRTRRRDRRHLDAHRGPARRGRAHLRDRGHARRCAPAPRTSPREALDAVATPAGRTTSLPALACPPCPPTPAWADPVAPAPPACRSSPSSGPPTWARARCSTACRR